ncbi:MAG: acyl-CoA dehydrogenase family protein [Novosphingobium sp.]
MTATAIKSAATIDWTAEATRIAAEIADFAARHDREDTFVEEGYASLKRAGFFSALVPADLGGGGASVAEIARCITILASGCSATALAFAMHSHIVAVAAWRRAHQGAPTEGLLRRVASEGLVLVSSGGSDWLESGGAAERVDGGYLITARKGFSSGSPMGDLLVTSAVTQDPESGPTVLHFALPLRGEGITHQPTWQVMGMRGTGSNDIQFERVFVADAAISGRRPAGEWHMLFHIISKIAFALIYAAYAGVAETARSKALALAAKRTPDPLLAQLAGELENEIAAMRLSQAEAVRIAEHDDPGEATTSAAMICRTLTGRHAIAATTLAMELAGGQAFYRKAGIEQLFRDVQAARFHPLQGRQQLDLTGRVALGWPI